ncbi:hypothetical protein [Nocardia acidivorans]|uniref:hypothetical protein n=1 Tax=Nocardia acidivorans TaxID=404580 RepID=UPI00083301FE|nr:hypothetical protein [Nocardia acidivorans]
MPAVALQTKPVRVKAIQFTGDNLHEINAELLGRKAYGNTACTRAYPGDQAYPAIYQDPTVIAEVWNSTLAQWLPLKSGDWVLQGTSGEFGPVSADAVAATYDVIAD